MNFEQQINHVINLIKAFWKNLIDFDGSRKYVDQLVQISEEIMMVRKRYEKYIQQHDETLEIQYLFDIFKGIIIQNTKAIGVTPPQQTAFFIS